MIRTYRVFTILTMLIVLNGCAGAYYSVPVKVNEPHDNSYFSASIDPTGKSAIAGFGSFILSIENHSNKDLELDWNKTYYIQNGQTNGTFMFQGIVFKDRNQTKSPDIIFAHSKFRKIIFPNNYTEYSNSLGSWIHRGTGLGRQGVYLTINVDGKTIRKKIIVDVKEGKR